MLRAPLLSHVHPAAAPSRAVCTPTGLRQWLFFQTHRPMEPHNAHSVGSCQTLTTRDRRVTSPVTPAQLPVWETTPVPQVLGVTPGSVATKRPPGQKDAQAKGRERKVMTLGKLLSYICLLQENKLLCQQNIEINSSFFCAWYFRGNVPSCI